MSPQASRIIKLAISVAEIEQCYPVMAQLRINFKVDRFVQQVQSQMTKGYQLAYICQQDEVVGVAGFKLDPSLILGQVSLCSGFSSR